MVARFLPNFYKLKPLGLERVVCLKQAYLALFCSMIKKKKLFVRILLPLFVAPLVAFSVSYLFVVGSSPGSALFDSSSELGTALAMTCWLIHVSLTAFFISPIQALAPQEFGHSKLALTVPSPTAFLIGIIFYLLLSLTVAALCGCFGSGEVDTD
jgi:hypothetical protein